MKNILVLLLGILFISLIRSVQGSDSAGLPLQVGHRENINEVSWSPDNTKLLSHSWGDSSLRLWDVKTGRQIWSVNVLFIQKEVETSTLISFDWSADQKLIASTGYNGSVQLWDAENGRKIRDFDIGYSHGNVLAFSPNGKTFITGGWNQNILMYELESGNLLWSLFPINQEEMQANKAEEARRIKYLQAKAEFEKKADKETESLKDKVYISFDHYGDMTELGKQRLLETDEPKKSRIRKPAKQANAIWLRLRNDSPLPIKIPTQSMYLSNEKCFHEFPDGQKLFGLCDNREISIWLGLEDKNGKPLPYGFDFGSSAILLPNNSVLFAVPRQILENGNSIRFGFTFQKENDKAKIGDFGTEKILRFGQSDLPEPKD